VQGQEEVAAQGADAVDGLADLGGGHARLQVGDVHRQQFLPAVAGHPGIGVVHFQQPAPGVQDEKTIQRGFDDRPVHVVPRRQAVGGSYRGGGFGIA